MERVFEHDPDQRLRADPRRVGVAPAGRQGLRVDPRAAASVALEVPRRPTAGHQAHRVPKRRGLSSERHGSDARPPEVPVPHESPRIDGSHPPHVLSSDWCHQQAPIKEKSMHKLVRTGIVTLAGTVVLGTAGVAIAGTAQAADHDTVVKREDTSTSWVQSTNLDDDPDDDQAGKAELARRPTPPTPPTRRTPRTRRRRPTPTTPRTRPRPPTRSRPSTPRRPRTRRRPTTPTDV